MKVLFASECELKYAEEVGITADLASARYRGILPAKELVKKGHKVHVFALGSVDPLTILHQDHEVVVIGKFFHEESLAFARAMKRSGRKVVADFCDDHFHIYGERQREMAQLADAVTASTGAMAAAIHAATGRVATVIGDPVEGPLGTPAFDPDNIQLRLLWFGHRNNFLGVHYREDELRTLAEWLPTMLHVVSNVKGPLDEVVERTAVSISVTDWSLKALWVALKNCDTVWLPVVPSHAATVKSANRVIESIWAGRLVVADDSVLAYHEFEKYTVQGDDLCSAIRWAVSHRDEVLDRIGCGQKLIKENYSKEAIGLKWEEVLTGVLNAQG